MTKLYTIEPYRYHVKPTTKIINDDEGEMSVTTWKYDSDATYYNFEVQFRLEQVKDDFHWENFGFFLADLNDQIRDVNYVLLKDGLLIIGGLKQKGNEE